VDATNVVTDYVTIKGEARSADEKFTAAIVAGYRDAFKKAGTMVKDAGGETAEVKFSAQPSYPPFNMADNEPALVHARRAAESIGLKPRTLFPTEAWMPTGWSGTASRPHYRQWAV
jgi:tripeptide aminopeptidase